MNILFIAQYYPEKLLATFSKKTKVGLDFAAHNLHKALLQGFKENEQKIDIVNAPHLGSFPPYYKTPFIPEYKSESERINSFSYINISYIKRWDIKRKMRKEMIRWCEKTKGKKVIFFYNFVALDVLPELKRRFKDVKACLLVTDLPEYMVADNRFLTRLNKNISSLFSSKDKSYFDYVDGYILLAPAMSERLPVNNKPWIQIEGIYNPEGNDIDVSKEKNKVILYTGNISKRYGIINLLDAFDKIKSPNYRLWIRGNGDTYNEIQRRIEKDNRITYFDMMSKSDLIKLQKRATILVNPIKSHEEFTRFFFPSKTLEYLASKTPTLMSPLECIPSEYNSFIYLFEDETTEGMCKRIIEICEKPNEELMEFGNNASNFIMQYKTPKPQVKKIIKFMDSL